MRQTDKRQITGEDGKKGLGRLVTNYLAVTHSSPRPGTGWRMAGHSRSRDDLCLGEDLSICFVNGLMSSAGGRIAWRLIGRHSADVITFSISLSYQKLFPFQAVVFEVSDVVDDKAPCCSPPTNSLLDQLVRVRLPAAPVEHVHQVVVGVVEGRALADDALDDNRD